MSGGGRILEQDDPFADLVPQKGATQGEAKPQSSGAADPFHDLIPQHDPFQDLVPTKPISIPPQPATAAADATRVGPEPVNLAGLLKEHPPGESGNLVNDVLETGMEQLTHPASTAAALVEQPFKAGETVGEYAGGRTSGKAAAIAAAQTAAVAAGGKLDELAEPLVARAIGERAAPFVTRTAMGSGTGALFTPGNPAIGATLGGGLGALSSRGAYARKLADRIDRFNAMAKEHPDWLTEEPSTPAAQETRDSRTLANPNGPRATATAEIPASDETEPDFVVEDPVRELGPFMGELVQHGKDFADALDKPPVVSPSPASGVPVDKNGPAPAPGVEQLRQQESDLFAKQQAENTAAGWPAPSEDAVDYFGDQAFEISHEETARSLWVDASDYFGAREALEQGVAGRKKDELERVAKKAEDNYMGTLSSYEDYFGDDGVKKFLGKTGLPADLTGTIESIPPAREFNNRISTGEPPTRANAAGVPGLVETRQPPVAAAPPAPAPPAVPKPQPPKKLEAAVKAPAGVVVSVPGKSLHLAPDVLQFKKSGIDPKTGVAPWVKGVKKYNAVLGGVWVTWINPADGKEYVVNSHHRKYIWDNDTSAGRPDHVNVIRIEAHDFAEARVIGARINIAEGHGTPLDVAQFIRDSGLTAADLEKEGISLRGDLARQGTALSQLTPDVLAKVGTGELAENHGVAIGEMLPGEPELQREVVREVKRSGRRLSADDVREVARQVHAAGTTDVRQETLFGGEVGRRPLFIERAQLATSIMKKLGQDRRILGFVAQEQRAQILAKGGNVIDVEKSRELADQSGRLEELFERLYTREGPIAKVLTQAASRVAHGQKVRTVADDIYADVAAAVQEEISRGGGSGESDRDAEGSGSVSSSPAETGEVRFSLEGAKTGKPFTVRTFRGQGASGPKYGEFSAGVPILGKGRYGTPNRSFAENFGDVTEHTAHLENPLVIASDAQWRELTRAAGWQFPNPVGLPKEVQVAGIDRLRASIEAKGHDGVIIRIPEEGDLGKTMRNVFDSDTIIEFNAPQSEKVEIDPNQQGLGIAEPQMRPENQASYNSFLARRKKAFLDAYRESKSVKLSAAAAGVGTTSVDKWRAKDAEFDKALREISEPRVGGTKRAAPTTKFSEPPLIAQRKAAYLKALAKTKSVEKAAAIANVDKTNVLYWRRSDPAFRAGEMHIKTPRPYRNEGKLAAPAEEKRELTPVDVNELRDHLTELRAQVERAGGFDIGRNRRAFVSEAANIMKSVVDIQTLEEARTKLNELAEDFTPIEGLEQEQRELHKLLHPEDVRRSLQKREAAELNPHEARAAQLHRERQDRYQAKKDAEAAPPKVEPINSYVEIYRAAKAAKAARENRVEEGGKKPYQTDLFIGSGEAVKPELRTGAKLDKAWPFHKMKERPASLGNAKTTKAAKILWGGVFNGKVVMFQTEPRLTNPGDHFMTPANARIRGDVANQPNYVDLVLEHGDLSEKELHELAQLAQLQDDERAIRYRRRGELLGAQRTLQVHEGERPAYSTQKPVGDLRTWEKDLFGYGGAGNGELFDEEAGRPGAPKPTDGGYKAKAIEARDRADFLKKQLARMQKSLDEFDHTASANNRPANDLSRKIDTVRKEIADLERIANFAEKLTTEEVRLRSEGEAPGDDKTLDIFKEPDIEPSTLTTTLRALEESIAGFTNSLPEIEKQMPDALVGEFRGIQAGMARVAKAIREQAPAIEKAGVSTPQFNQLAREWYALANEHLDVSDRANAMARTKRELHFPGDMRVWEGDLNNYQRGLQDWWSTQSRNSRIALLKKWKKAYAHWSIGGITDFNAKYADVKDARDLPDHLQRAAVIERQLEQWAMKTDLNVWEDPSQLHLFYTYGSVEKFQAAAKEVLDHSGKFVSIADSHERGAQVLSSRQRRRNIEMAKQKGAFVDIVGKKVRGPHDIAQLLFPFRSPEMERFSVLLTDDEGTVLSHTMETSGVINYSVIPETLAKTIARRARVVGATRVHFAHNHPSGDPTPSDEDKRMTMEFAYQLKRRGLTLVDHVIINHKTYGWLKPGEAKRTGTADITIGRKLPYDLPSLSDRSDWTQGHGGIVKSPLEVAGLAATALQGSDFGALYLTSQGHTVALEPRPKGDLDTIQKWVGDALKAHAATKVAIVYNPAEHGDQVDAIKDKLENFPYLGHQLFDVVPFDGSQSLQEEAPHLLLHAQSEAALLPRPSKRLIGEGRKGYGGRTSGPEGEGEDRSQAADANDRRADASALPAEREVTDRRSTEPAELHDPQLDRSAGTLARLSYEVRRILTPAKLTRESAETARLLRAASGRMIHRREMASKALRQFSSELTRLSPKDRLAFIQQIETGEKVTTTPGLAAAADQLRSELDRVRDRVRGLGTGKLENFIENYFPHIWKDPKRARTLIQQMMQRRPLQGNRSWLKKRTLPTTADGIAIGLEPITDNPLDLALLRIFQMNKYVMAHEILQEMKNKGPNFLKYLGAHEKLPAGYRYIDDSAFTVFGRPAVPVKEAFDPVLRGHLVEILARLGGKHQRTLNMREWGTAEGSQVRTKFGGDIGVLMHEIGHVLDTKYKVWDQLHEPIESRTVTRGKKKGQSVPTKDAIAYRVKIDKELRALADLRMEGQNPDDIPEHHKQYLRSRAEKIANAIHALVYMPDRMAGVAPTVKSALTSLLSSTPAADILNPKRGVALGVGVAEKGIYGTLITGRYAAPDAVATVVNNFLSPGLRGNPIYDAYMGIGNTLNQAQLGLSFFHLGFTSLDAMVSKLALSLQQIARGQLESAGGSLLLTPAAAVSNFIQGSQVFRAYLDPARAGKYDEVVKAIERAGGKVRMDEFYRNNNVKKLLEGIAHRDPVTIVARLPLAAFELSARFVLEYVVPRQKLGVFADMAMMEARRLGPDATEDELRRAAQRAWDSTDNRMGQMVYDNLMWNRVLKDTLMGLVRAVGWDLGTFRELIGGASDIVRSPVRAVLRLRDRRAGGEQEAPGAAQDPIFTHKAAYVLALFAGVGALGAALNKGMTGEWPKDLRDLWTPRTGKTNDEGNPERVELPSYVKDVRAYSQHPMQTVLHKLHPLLNYVASVLENEDYYGNMVRNPDDPALVQLKQELEYFAKEFEPFGFRNAAEQAKRNQSRPVQIGNFIGVTPAKRQDTRTPAENEMADLLRAKGEKGLTPEESELRQSRGIIRAGKREGKPKGSVIADAMRQAPISHRDADRIWSETEKNAQLEQFKRLDFLDAKKVWDVASAEERRRWHYVFVQKRANYRALHGAAATR